MGALGLLARIALVAAIPALASKPVTIAELEQNVQSLRAKPDAEAAWALSNLEPTERISPSTLAQLQQDLPGEKSRETLLALADVAAFLNPPLAEIPNRPAPDVAEQRRILGLVVSYVSKTIPELPNFLATKQVTRFESTPSGYEQQGFTATKFEPLHRVGSSSEAVRYADGREFASAGSKGAENGATQQGLNTWGEFGPVLSTVLLDAAQNKLAWSHWEQGQYGLLAVFNYTVLKEKSHYEVNYCCVVDSEDQPHNFHELSAYHGAIVVDPASGTILRLRIEADLKPDEPVSRAAILVEYGPIEIGARTYICPVRSLALSKAQSIAKDKDILIPAGPPSGPTAGAAAVVHSTSYTPGPVHTFLNDAIFEQYHVFRADARILTEKAGNSQQAPSQGRGDFLKTPSVENSTAAVSAPPEEAGTIHAATRPPYEPATAPASPATHDTTPSPVQQPPESEMSVTNLAELANNRINSSPSSSEEKFTLRTTSRLVDMSVVAYDRKGRTIAGLTPADFEVYDNGVKQEIRSFSSGGSALVSVAPSHLVSAAEELALSNSAARNATPRFGERSVTILLIDESNLAFADLAYAREEMLRFLKGLPGDEAVGLYIMGANGFKILLEPTVETTRIETTLRNWVPDAQALARAQDEEQRNRQQFEYVHSMYDLAHVNGNAYMDPSSFTSTQVRGRQQAGNNPLSQPTDARLLELGSNPGRDALWILEDVGRHLAQYPGHKSLIWVASDNVLADWSSNAAAKQDEGSKFVHSIGLRAQEILNNAHVSIYPLDASQLEAGGVGADIGTRNVLAIGRSDRDLATANMGDAAPGMKPGRVTAQMQQDTHPIQGEFKDLAQATGARALRRAGDVAAELSGIVAEGDAIYMLSFTPSQPPDDTYHHLTVKVLNHGDITLRYRSGYLYSNDPGTIDRSGSSR
jgi:VWFA-related protein